eukprot:5392077-Prymnesium_polylepis.2
MRRRQSERSAPVSRLQHKHVWAHPHDRALEATVDVDAAIDEFHEEVAPVKSERGRVPVAGACVKYLLAHACGRRASSWQPQSGFEVASQSRVRCSPPCVRTKTHTAGCWSSVCGAAAVCRQLVCDCVWWRARTGPRPCSASDTPACPGLPARRARGAAPCKSVPCKNRRRARRVAKCGSAGRVLTPSAPAATAHAASARPCARAASTAAVTSSRCCRRRRRERRSSSC